MTTAANLMRSSKAVFTPGSIPNLDLWVEASSLSFGGGVWSCVDKNGSGLTLTSGGTAGNLTISGAQILFAGGVWLVGSKSYASGGSYTWIIRFRRNNSGSFWGICGLADVADAIHVGFLDFPSSGSTLFGRKSSAGTADLTVVDTQTVYETATLIVTGSSSKLYVNGSLVASNSTVAATEAMTRVFLGAFGPGGGQPFVGGIKCAMLLSRAITGTEQTNLETYQGAL